MKKYITEFIGIALPMKFTYGLTEIPSSAMSITDIACFDSGGLLLIQTMTPLTVFCNNYYVTSFNPVRSFGFALMLAAGSFLAWRCFRLLRLTGVYRTNRYIRCCQTADYTDNRQTSGGGNAMCALA